jgi:hypothetical protein
MSGGSNTPVQEVPDLLAPSTINDSPYIPGFPSLASTAVEAELIGDVADVRHRTVMVQAQIIERPRTSFSGSEYQSTQEAGDIPADTYLSHHVSLTAPSSVPRSEATDLLIFDAPTQSSRIDARTQRVSLQPSAPLYQDGSLRTASQLNHPLSMSTTEASRPAVPDHTNPRGIQNQQYYYNHSTSAQDPSEQRLPSSQYSASAPYRVTSSPQQLPPGPHRLASAHAANTPRTAHGGEVHSNDEEAYRFGKPRLLEIPIRTCCIISHACTNSIFLQVISQGVSLLEEDSSMAGMAIVATNL